MLAGALSQHTKGEKRVPRYGGVFINAVRTMTVTFFYDHYVVMKEASSATADVKSVVRPPFALLFVAS